MSYIALYRKWRPLVFEDVVEQEHVVKTLKNAVKSARIAHAYLFCGTRGTGKTSMAKIFSRAINCLNPRDGDPCNECDICRGILSGSLLDVIEIDAASNNSVDNIRDIRDEVIYTPSSAKYKVYIIDEVHMLSSGAFNALLKTLEEPPSHAVFILATTEPHKLPATILSRCQRFDFRRIPIESIMGRLDRIAEASGVSLHKEASKLIAKMADGALRDAISILDQCMAVGAKEVSYEDVLTVVGIVNDTFISEIVDAINSKDINHILKMVEKLVMDGKDISKFVSDLVLYYRNLLICKITDKPEEIIDVTPDAVENMKRQCSVLSQDEMMLIIRELSALETGLKWAAHPRILLELSIVKICDSNFNSDRDSLLERLSVLENRISNGNFTVKNETGNNQKSREASEPVKDKGMEGTSEEVKNKPKKLNTAALKTLDNWNDILEDLKNSGRMVIYTNLLDAKAVEIDSKVVGIALQEGSRFCKMILSKPENQEIIAEAISKRLGREIRVKCVDEEDVARGMEEGKREKKDELTQKAQDIAKKLNMPLDIIDE